MALLYRRRSKGVAIEAQEAAEAGTLGYMARALTLATMPHSKQEGNEFHRKNGAFSMSMLAPSNLTHTPLAKQPLKNLTPTESQKTRERHLLQKGSLPTARTTGLERFNA